MSGLGVGFLTKSDYRGIGNKDGESVAQTIGEALLCAVTSRYVTFFNTRATVRKATSSN